MPDNNIVCWAEIPVTDMHKAVAFYGAAFGWDMKVDESGPNPMAWLGGVSDAVGGHLYPGKPAAGGNGPTVHIVVPDTCESTAERVKKAGGTVLTPPIDIPVGRFVYAMDPDGNSLGLFQPKG